MSDLKLSSRKFTLFHDISSKSAVGWSRFQVPGFNVGHFQRLTSCWQEIQISQQPCCPLYVLSIITFLMVCLCICCETVSLLDAPMMLLHDRWFSLDSSVSWCCCNLWLNSLSCSCVTQMAYHVFCMRARRSCSLRFNWPAKSLQLAKSAKTWVVIGLKVLTWYYLLAVFHCL